MGIAVLLSQQFCQDDASKLSQLSGAFDTTETSPWKVSVAACCGLVYVLQAVKVDRRKITEHATTN